MSKNTQIRVKNKTSELFNVQRYTVSIVIELNIGKKHLKNVKEINRYDNRREKNSGVWIFRRFKHFSSLLNNTTKADRGLEQVADEGLKN